MSLIGWMERSLTFFCQVRKYFTFKNIFFVEKIHLKDGIYSVFGGATKFQSKHI